MNQRRLGKTDISVSSIGLGCINFGSRVDADATRAIVHRALDLGITFFDTADVYGRSEEYLGLALGPRRKEVVIATKFGLPMSETARGASPQYIRLAVETSLRRLKTDWIDLYQLHVPDPTVSIAETLDALDRLIKQGKVRQIGCSNLRAWQVEEAQLTSQHRDLKAFVTCQDEYSLLVRKIEDEVLPVMQRYELALFPYYPLACGLLTGKYREPAMSQLTRLTTSKKLSDRYMTPANLQTVQAIAEFAKATGRTILDLALAWLLTRPCVASVLVGATSPEQIEQNVKASLCQLSDDDIAILDQITARDVKILMPNLNAMPSSA